MPHMTFVDLAVPVENRLSGYALFIKFQDLLLVFAGDLGIRNDERWDQGVRFAAEAASDTLNDE